MMLIVRADRYHAHSASHTAYTEVRHMLLDDIRLIEALQDERKTVRSFALRTLATTCCPRPEIVPTMLAVLEARGIDEAFEYLICIEQLTWTAESVLRAAEFLHGTPVSRARAESWLLPLDVQMLFLLNKLPIELLEPASDRLLAIPKFATRFGRGLSLRREAYAANFESLQRDLIALIRTAMSAPDGGFPDQEADALVEGLARHADRASAWAKVELGVFETETDVEFNDEDSEYSWLEPYYIRLLGLTRSVDARNWLLNLDSNALNDHSSEAWGFTAARLIDAESVPVLVAAANHFGWSCGHLMCLSSVRCPAALQALLERMQSDNRWDMQPFAAQGVVNQCSSDANQTVYEFAQQNYESLWDIPDWQGVFDALDAVSHLTGQSFPDITGWQAEWKVERERRTALFHDIGEPFFEPAPRFQPIADEWDGYATAVEPIVATARVGRNDPCPCGSGKKFKKCCLKSTAE